MIRGDCEGPEEHVVPVSDRGDLVQALLAQQYGDPLPDILQEGVYVGATETAGLRSFRIAAQSLVGSPGCTTNDWAIEPHEQLNGEVRGTALGSGARGLLSLRNDPHAASTRSLRIMPMSSCSRLWQ